MQRGEEREDAGKKGKKKEQRGKRRQKKRRKKRKKKNSKTHPKNAIIVTTATASSTGVFLRGLARSAGWSLTSGPGHCVHPAESLWRMRRTRPVSSVGLLLLVLLLPFAGGGRRSSRFCGLGGVGVGLALLLLLLVLPSLLVAVMVKKKRKSKRERERERKRRGEPTCVSARRTTSEGKRKREIDAKGTLRSKVSASGVLPSQ